MNPGTGKTALITGASSGIGQELANLFARDGYNLVLVARSGDTLDRLAEVFKDNYGTGQITVISKDLSEENAAQDVYDQVKAKGITVNALVNDAGVGLHGLFATDTDWEREKSMIHLNVLTLTQMTKLFLYDMLARNEGRILNLASLLSITPTPLMAVYAGTKAYVYNFTQSLVNELKDSNVTITALLPNATDTDFFNKADAADVNVTDEMQDPVMVAKAGYAGMMAGKSKVVPGGLKNKSYEVMAYVAPQEALASLMREKMTPKSDSDTKKESSSAMAWGIGFGVAVLAGFALVTLYHESSPLDKARYRQQAGKLKDQTMNLFDDAGESLGNAQDAATDKWAGVKKIALDVLTSTFSPKS